jgi:hypothetical protein
MTQRKWVLHENMGYAGTDSEDEIDLVDDWNYSEKEVEAMTDEEAEKMLSDEAWQAAIEKISAWAEKGEE